MDVLQQLKISGNFIDIENRIYSFMGYEAIIDNEMFGCNKMYKPLLMAFAATCNTLAEFRRGLDDVQKNVTRVDNFVRYKINVGKSNKILSETDKYIIIKDKNENITIIDKFRKTKIVCLDMKQLDSKNTIAKCISRDYIIFQKTHTYLWKHALLKIPEISEYCRLYPLKDYLVAVKYRKGLSIIFYNVEKMRVEQKHDIYSTGIYDVSFVKSTNENAIGVRILERDTLYATVDGVVGLGNITTLICDKCKMGLMYKKNYVKCKCGKMLQLPERPSIISTQDNNIFAIANNVLYTSDDNSGSRLAIDGPVFLPTKSQTEIKNDVLYSYFYV